MRIFREEISTFGQNRSMYLGLETSLIGVNGSLVSHSILNSRYSTWIFLSYGVFICILVFSVLAVLRRRRENSQQQGSASPEAKPLLRRPKPKRAAVRPPPPDPIEGRVTFQTSKTEVVAMPVASSVKTPKASEAPPTSEPVVTESKAENALAEEPKVEELKEEPKEKAEGSS